MTGTQYVGLGFLLAALLICIIAVLPPRVVRAGYHTYLFLVFATIPIAGILLLIFGA